MLKDLSPDAKVWRALIGVAFLLGAVSMWIYVWRHTDRYWLMYPSVVLVLAAGVAFLMVDGPPGAWEARYEEVRWIAMLLRVTPPPETPDGTVTEGSSK